MIINNNTMLIAASQQRLSEADGISSNLIDVRGAYSHLNNKRGQIYNHSSGDLRQKHLCLDILPSA